MSTWFNGKTILTKLLSRNSDQRRKEEPGSVNSGDSLKGEKECTRREGIATKGKKNDW